jgi:hypothetical protein
MGPSSAILVLWIRGWEMYEYILRVSLPFSMFEVLYLCSFYGGFTWAGHQNGMGLACSRRLSSQCNQKGELRVMGWFLFFFFASTCSIAGLLGSLFTSKNANG